LKEPHKDVEAAPHDEPHQVARSYLHLSLALFDV
jgi:hypothetical protein